MTNIVLIDIVLSIIINVICSLRPFKIFGIIVPSHSMNFLINSLSLKSSFKKVMPIFAYMYYNANYKVRSGWFIIIIFQCNFDTLHDFYTCLT